MKIAVVTGASSGMGREFLIRVASEYELDEIWAIARREEKLLELSSLVKTKIRAIPMDLSEEKSYEQLNELYKTEKPEISVLVNASGFGKFGTIENIPLSDSLSMIDVNCKALVAVTELSLPYLSEGAVILQIGSLSSFQPVPYMTVYGASKAFVLSYTRALGVELRNKKVKVMAICPGWVKTEFFDTAWKTNKGDVDNYDKFYTAKQIVDCAFKDLKKNKKLSVCGGNNKFQVTMVKFLPVNLVMKTWLKRQGHKW